MKQNTPRRNAATVIRFDRKNVNDRIVGTSFYFTSIFPYFAEKLGENSCVATIAKLAKWARQKLPVRNITMYSISWLSKTCKKH
jgi:hypothetical protein